LPPLYWIATLIPAQSVQNILRAGDIAFEYGGKAVRNMQDQSGSSRNLFSQMLAEAENEKNETLSEDSVRLEAGNLIVAGSDTTAVTLTYLVWMVLKDPKLQKQLEEEVAGLSSDLRAEELTDAPLLNSVIDETLRLYGAAPGSLPRTVPSQGAMLCGHTLPAGTIVSTQAFTLHRDSNIFPNPDKYALPPHGSPTCTFDLSCTDRWARFDGWRFMDKSKLPPAQKSAFQPFGAGSRVCLGIHLAYMELRLGVALFFRECKGARIAKSMTDEMMEIENRFLIAPIGHRCMITLQPNAE
jgi:cytochrome P450